MLKHLLESKDYLQKYLYSRGFLITDDYDVDIIDYPFYNDYTAVNEIIECNCRYIGKNWVSNKQ